MPKAEVKKEKKTRTSRIKRDLSNVKQIFEKPYVQKLVLERLQSTHCDRDCFKDIRVGKEMNLEEAVATIARNVQENVPKVARDSAVTSLDNIAQMVTDHGAKGSCQSELPIILRGLHLIYPLPEMQDQAPFDVKNLYQFLHFLSLGQPAPALDEGLLMILREAYDELMQEVNSDESVGKIEELEKLLKDFSSKSSERKPNNATLSQHIIQPTPDLMDPSFNLLQIPSEMLFMPKDN